MIAKKKINNNVALCVDNYGKELIAFGKGIGFPVMPYIIEDLSVIKKTFYAVSEQYIDLINSLSEETIYIASNIIVNLSDKTGKAYNSNLVFTLADHIEYAIKRYRKKINFYIPYDYNIRYLYKEEYLVASNAVKIINQKFKVNLDINEVYAIAIHLINAIEINENEEKIKQQEIILNKITQIIQETMQIEIDKNTVYYSRFVAHIMAYLNDMSRETKQTDYSTLFSPLKEEYTEQYICTLKIAEYLESEIKNKLSENEVSFLMIHIVRICDRNI